MTTNEDLFLQRYNNLNERQKQAVDTVYGPVMVIAGPGTGKTEVLSMRIANLLRSEAQVQPQEILCLTYTDEASSSMRRRLLQIIGPAAHRVNINTFHSFCNNVIQSNSEYFSKGTLQSITDLERTELLYKMIEELPSGHSLRRLSGNLYNDASKLSRLFDLMKREHLKPDEIVSAIEAYLADLPNREKFIYKKAYKEFKKGDLKQIAVDEETRKMNLTRDAALLLDVYSAKMREAGRYDFNDMIIWVIEEFKRNPYLLQSYQERNQFILVDEFQDTNGSQNDLLNMLTDFWDEANIFVVGDDDQGIYEFQGARIRNIIDFYQHHKENIQVIVLPENYRSSQAILNKAMATINNNAERLIKQLQELNLNKDIVAAADRFKNGDNTVTPVVKAYQNILQEETDVLQQIEALQLQNVPLKDIAIIYAQHKQADNIIALMERKGIPYNVRKPVDVLTLPLIEQVINILRYLDEERKKPFEAESVLFELMHAPYFDISPTDIAMLSLYIQNNRGKDKPNIRWRFLLTNQLLLESLDIRSAKAMSRLGIRLEQWERDQLSLPLPLLIEKIVYESGMVAHLLRTPDHVWSMQVLYTFFEFVKDTYNRDAKIKPAALLRMLEQMQAEKITIPVQRVVQNDNGVHFYTVHSAKGNEFEHVFIIGSTKNFWEDKRGGGNEYSLPDTITNTNEDTEKTYKVEVARRLYYVAMTRAKKHLHISFALNDNAGKGLIATRFIDEISTPEERIMQTVTAEAVVGTMATAMQPVPDVRIKMANAQWIERTLQQFIMSYTALSKFLRCPLEFYYETILKVPYQKSDALAFGSAVHYALERMFREMKEHHGEFPDKDHVVGYFTSALYSESSSFTPVQFERRMEQGKELIVDYYNHYLPSFHTDVEIEYKVPRYILDGVPVTGKIDKLELHGDTCTVIDYKTGDPDKSANANVAPPNEKEPNGGDYWRQMVFYKLILENFQERNWRVTMGTFDYVQKGGKTNQYKRLTVPMYAQDEDVVRNQLKDSYTRIMNHEFDRGCGKETCHWCNFAKRYELIRPVDEVEVDDV